jgi:transposase
VYAVADDQGHMLFRKRLPNRLPAVLEALAPFKEDLRVVAVEATYNWYWLVDGLMDHAYSVRLANPGAMKQYTGLKDANDDSDAGFLAELARLQILPTGYIYPQEDRPVRDLLRRRSLLVRQRTALILSLQNMVVRQAGQSLSWHKICQQDETFPSLLREQEILPFLAREQIDLIEQLGKKIELFEKKVLEKAKLKSGYKRLLTLPGVGPILALTILLETGDIARFPKVGCFTSYCRCVRAKRTSNGKCKGSNNRKNGNKHLAWAFVEAAHHAIACCPQAKAFYDRKKAHRNGALATKALAAKWAKAAYYVMKRQENFDLKRVFG